MNECSLANLFDLSGRRVLLTGATGFLGAAFAEALAEAGATVIASSRSQQAAEEVAAQLPTRSGPHHAVCLDHTDPQSIAKGFAQALEVAGGIDVLVNNGNAACADDWTSVTNADFNDHLRNVSGYFELARCLRSHVLQRNAGGVVVMIGSMYGMVASYPDAYDGVCAASPVAYHASKGGIIHLTRHLGVYWAKDGVRVNCLSPGAFPNPEKVPEGLVPRLETKCPMGRMGSPHELKGAIVFLSSDASSYMTGQNLVIDGGWTSQ